MIDTAELESEAATQAQEDINQPPWVERTNVHTVDTLQWITQQVVRFDLIISDPLYCRQGIECVTPQREQARYTTTLDYPSLLIHVVECVIEERFFCMVLPEQTGNGFIELVLSMDWYLHLQMDVAENEARLPHRALLAFSLQAGECFSDHLVTRGSDQNHSETYTVLTQAFYPFMQWLPAERIDGSECVSSSG